MDLSDCILVRNISEEYKQRLFQLDTYLSTRLDLIQRYFPDFTDHGIGHSRRVLESLCDILSKRNIANEFNEVNSLIAICACYLHDIGMGPITPEELEESMKTDFVIDKKWRDDIIREEHQERTYRWILESDEFSHELSWFPNELRILLAAVARGHREIRIHEDEILQQDSDLQFLTALLRLADQMDLSEDRVTYLGYYRKHLPTRDEVQTREFAKSLCKAEVYLSDEDDQLILKSEQPFDEVVILMLDALYALSEDIEQTIEQTKIYSWRGNTILPNRLSFDFHVVGEDTDQHCIGAHFQNVLKYLSNSIYADQHRTVIPLREAISNAIDSCNLQELVDSNSNCEIHIASTDDEIWIWDNGRGMAPRVIENYLKILGASYYESPWFRGDPNLPSRSSIPLIGLYGIGIFSFLLVSDEFEIITATDMTDPRRVVFSRRFAITLGPLPASDLVRGTIVILKKPRSMIERWPTEREVVDIVKKQFPFPPIPIILHIEDGEYTLSKFESANIYDSVLTDNEINIKYQKFTELEDSIKIRTDLQIEITTQDLQIDEESTEVMNILQVRGIRIPYKIETSLPFTLALLSLTEIFKNHAPNCNLKITIYTELEGDDIIPTITKNQLIKNESRDTAFLIREKQIEVLASTFFSKFLQMQMIDWSIREQIRNIVFNQMMIGYGYFDLYETVDELPQSLLCDIRFYDWNSDTYVPIDTLIRESEDYTICIASIDSVEQYRSMFKRGWLIFLPRLFIKHRNIKKVIYAEAVAKYKKWFGKKVESPKIYFFEYGRSIMMEKYKFFKWILQRNGVTNWIVIEENPYRLKKNGYSKSRFY